MSHKMEKFIKNFINSIASCDLETGYFPGPVVTISRQAGCSAKRIAIKLSKILTGYSYMSDTKTDAEWKWVDKDLFEDVVKDMITEVKSSGYDDSEEAVKILTQAAKVFSDETIYDITDEMMLETFKGVICRLAYKGRVIIINPSAGVILNSVPNKLNIRLEAPLEWRINRIMQLKDLTQAESVEFVREMDSKRDIFIEKIIGRNTNNDDFDVIFNYASMQDDEIIDAVVNILKNKKIISPYDDF
jgi:hypothetical protein